MNRRDYCRCASVQNFSYAAAAAKLGCTMSYLQENIRLLPHQKIGGKPVFCECELRLIQAMNTNVPDTVAELLADDVPAETAMPGQPETGPLSLASIVPSGARRKTAS